MSEKNFPCRSLSEIKDIVFSMAKIISADEKLLPTFGILEQFSKPCIRVDGKGYHILMQEKSQVYDTVYLTLNDLLEAIFSDVCTSMAYEYACKNAPEETDQRRISFPKKIELISMLNPEWGQYEEISQEETLKKHPFNDEIIKNAILARKKKYEKKTAQ